MRSLFEQAMAESAKIFIHYLTATANDACRDSKRSTISADDVLRAVEDIEFADFVPPLQASLEGFKKEAAQKKAAAGKRKAKDMCVACAARSRHPFVTTTNHPSANPLPKEQTDGCSYPSIGLLGGNARAHSGTALVRRSCVHVHGSVCLHLQPPRRARLGNRED